MIALIANICLTCFPGQREGSRVLGRGKAARQNQALGKNQAGCRSQAACRSQAEGQNQAACRSRALDRLSLEPGEPRAYGGDDYGRQHVCRLEGTRPDEVDSHAKDEYRAYEGEVGECLIR